MDITGFLLARIAEDEQVARSAAECEEEPHAHWQAVIEEGAGSAVVEDCGCVVARRPWDAVVPGDEAEHIARWDPARVLAECEAKRRIMEAHPMGPGADGSWNYTEVVGCLTCVSCGVDGEAIIDAGPCPTLRALAAPYAEHPDFRPEWSVEVSV